MIRFIGTFLQNNKLVLENNAVIARPVRTLVVAIPRLVGKCTEKHPKNVNSYDFWW